MMLHCRKMKLIIISSMISVSLVLTGPTKTSGVDSNTCNPRGTRVSHENGQCLCKENVSGHKCNECNLGTFHLSSENELGCTRCYCMGVTHNCTSSNWNRSKIKISDSGFSGGISLIRPYTAGAPVITSGFHLDESSGTIKYDGFPNGESKDIHFWQLPIAFSGNLLASYGGSLKYAIKYIPLPGSPLGFDAPAVTFISSNSLLISYYETLPLEPNSLQSFNVVLLEKFWIGQMGTISRGSFLTALANITAIRLRATYTMWTKSVSISNVSLDTATMSNTELGRADELEQCRCPIEYIGLSCEKCATGYTRNHDKSHPGSCQPCDCNGHSEQCNPEDGVCQNCHHRTTGEHCELCEPGYEKDPTTGDCTFVEPLVPEGAANCYCNPAGSKNNECIDGACQCKSNVVGVNCDSCRSSTFGLSGDNVNGCNECFCSGRSNQCNGSPLHIQSITSDFHNPDHVFAVVDAAAESHTTNHDLQAFPLSNEIQYHFDPNIRERQLMWSLSSIFTGNKVKSYGGYLKLAKKFTSRLLPAIIASQEVIIEGNGLTLSWESSPTRFYENRFVTFSIPLRESQWRTVLGDGRRRTSRPELMTALSDLKAIFVPIIYDHNIETISISNVSLDTAVDDFPGGDRATQVEVCECPSGYTGTSCESCSRGYYRNITKGSTSALGDCIACPCSNHEESCKMDDNAQVQCYCVTGYIGKYCQELSEEELILSVRVEPKVQFVREGAAAEVNCVVNDRDLRVDVRWMPYGKISLGPHAQQKGRTLRIIGLRAVDSGMYICRAYNGERAATAIAVINVIAHKGPVLKVYPRNSQSIVQGGSVSLQCRDLSAQDQTSAVHWARADGRSFPSNVVQLPDGFLRIINITIDDDGTYQCSAENGVGTAKEFAKVGVESIPVITITPSIGRPVSVRLGENVTLTCTADGRPEPYVIWSRYSVKTRYTSFPSRAQSSAIYEIASMSEDDEGMYVCTANNSAGTREERIFVLVDHASPPPSNADTGIRIFMDYMSIPVGKNVQMSCVIVGFDVRRIHLRWRRSNGLAIPSDRIADGLLTIPQVTKMDADRYTCLGLDSDGTELYRVISHLDVISPPRILLTPSNETVNLGATPSIHCIATGDGTITTKWTAIGQEQLPPYAEDNNGVLKFHGIADGHVGKYLCNATNEAGSVFQVAQVLFEPQECN